MGLGHIQEKDTSVWSRCLTRLEGHPCPWCKSVESVFTGHGTVRFCTNCVVSWGQSEEHDLRSRLKEGQFEEQTFRQKIANLPSNMRKIANASVKLLNEASRIGSRLAKLRAITNEEWQKAVDNSPEPEEI